MLHSWDTARTYQKPSLYARAVQREFPQNGETEVVTCSTQESFLPYWKVGGRLFQQPKPTMGSIEVAAEN